MPWYWIVSDTIPAPGAVVGSTLRYPLLIVPLALVMPKRVDKSLSGFIAIRLPPPLTQVVKVLAWAAVTLTLPSTYDVIGRQR